MLSCRLRRCTRARSTFAKALSMGWGISLFVDAEGDSGGQVVAGELRSSGVIGFPHERAHVKKCGHHCGHCIESLSLRFHGSGRRAYAPVEMGPTCQVAVFAAGVTPRTNS